MMTTANIAKEFLDQADKLTNEELRAVNATICEILRNRQAIKQLTAAMQFKKGDDVEFKDTRTGRMVHGHIEKINRKSIIVIEKKTAPKQLDKGAQDLINTHLGTVRWTVSPSLLRPYTAK